MNSFIYTFYTLFCARSCSDLQHLQTFSAVLNRQQCCIYSRRRNNDNNDHHHHDDDVAPLQLPFAPVLALALPCPALPWQCPVCLGHKSKEQIAAAKAVKANKPKCRRNKLANVMDATRRGKYSRQGVECGATASGVVALLRSSSLSFTE